MSGELLKVNGTCRQCGKVLTIEEMHYLASEDGTATCETCEEEWLKKMDEWRNGSDDAPMPDRP